MDKFYIAIASLLLLLQGCEIGHDNALYWSSIHVSGEETTGDAHLLELPDGRAFLIDTGYPRFAESDLLPYLRERNIKRLDGILVTHAHRNHYGSLKHIAKEIEIGTVFFNVPDPKLCFKEAEKDRCSIEFLQQTIASLPGVKAKQARTGDVLLSGDNLSLRVIHQANSLASASLRHFDSKDMSYTINESSVVSRLEYGDISILFPGDIGPTTGAFLSEDRPKLLRSTLLAAPHHGASKAPDDAFFDAVKPKFIVASIGGKVFDKHYGDDLREIVKKRNLPLVVTGHSGNVRFRITSSSYQLLLPKP